jgi:hypothetical protein
LEEAKETLNRLRTSLSRSDFQTLLAKSTMWALRLNDPVFVELFLDNGVRCLDLKSMEAFDALPGHQHHGLHLHLPHLAGHGHGHSHLQSDAKLSAKPVEHCFHALTELYDMAREDPNGHVFAFFLKFNGPIFEPATTPELVDVICMLVFFPNRKLTFSVLLQQRAGPVPSAQVHRGQDFVVHCARVCARSHRH